MAFLIEDQEWKSYVLNDHNTSAMIDVKPWQLSYMADRKWAEQIKTHQSLHPKLYLFVNARHLASYHVRPGCNCCPRNIPSKWCYLCASFCVLVLSAGCSCRPCRVLGTSAKPIIRPNPKIKTTVQLGLLERRSTTVVSSSSGDWLWQATSNFVIPVRSCSRRICLFDTVTIYYTYSRNSGWIRNESIK